MVETLDGCQGSYRVDPSHRRHGGQAEVLPAWGAHGVRVAVRRVISPGMDDDWVRDETALLKDIHARHPEAAAWLVAVLDEGRCADGRRFQVLPWYEWTLDGWITRAGPGPERVLYALEGAATALARLHRSPADVAEALVHRDVKPANFLVRDEAGRLDVVLADLGLCARGDVLAPHASSGSMSIPFAPPEQRLPVLSPLDPSVDVYALAVMAVASLGGMPPESALSDNTSPDGRRLLELHRRGPDRSAAEESAYQGLRTAPLSALTMRGPGPSLSESDRRRLVSRIADGLVGRVPSPVDTAEAVVARIGPEIEAAIQADPEARTSDAGRLASAFRSARARMESVVGVAAVGPVRPAGHGRTPTPGFAPVPRARAPGPGKPGDPARARLAPRLFWPLGFLAASIVAASAWGAIGALRGGRVRPAVGRVVMLETFEGVAPGTILAGSGRWTCPAEPCLASVVSTEAGRSLSLEPSARGGICLSLPEIADRDFSLALDFHDSAIAWREGREGAREAIEITLAGRVGMPRVFGFQAACGGTYGWVAWDWAGNCGRYKWFGPRAKGWHRLRVDVKRRSATHGFANYCIDDSCYEDASFGLVPRELCFASHLVDRVMIDEIVVATR